MLGFLSLLFFAAIPQALATEVDSFTDRDSVTQDSLRILDQEMNRRLHIVIQKSNKRKGCSTKTLYFHLGHQLRAGVKG